MNKSKIVLSALLAGALAVSSFAAGSLISINVDPSIKILVNGEEFKPKDANGNDVMVFTHNGTTYAPLRALAEAYGLEVGYDANRKMATVDSLAGIYDMSNTLLYEDQNIAISYCQNYQEETWLGTYYGVQLMVENKTEIELTFQADAISLNGFSYEVSGSDEVAANSKGYIYFEIQNDTPPRTTEVYRVNGKISVIDFTYTHDELYYDVEIFGEIS